MKPTILPIATLAATAAAAGLNTAAKGAGLRYFGSATDNPEFTDSAYVAELSNTDDFGQITPGNTQKWVYVEPSQNSFSYAQGDAVVSLAQKNNQLVRCHNLVWYNELPDWVTSGSWTNATLQAALKNHITNEVTHYKGKCFSWDVVNEALSDSGGYRSNVFYNIIGPAYIPLAFKWAAAADPDVKLYYNDYNIESAGTKSSQAQDIVKMIQAYGTKIDGVGMQSHFIVGQTPSTTAQVSNMAAFTSLGVDVAITELDIRMTLPSTPVLLAQQSIDYASTVTACLQTKRCVGITVWDYTDKYSWVPSTFSGQGAACPWDANLVKKPAYNGILSALGGAAKPSSMTSPTVPVTTATTFSATSSSSMTVSTATAASPSATAAEWGQCGGIGWTGATSCPYGWTCKVGNPYYSQCLQ